MASGFIIFEDGRCFAPRYTVYDEVINILIKESRKTDGANALSDWLELQIPQLTEEITADSGWGFFNERTAEWQNRHLDLRSLTKENQDAIWRAAQWGNSEFLIYGEQYSPLRYDIYKRFHTMFYLSIIGSPPMELTDWNKPADPCDEKNGPGW